MGNNVLFSGQNIQACILDFDGVVIDSEPLHAKAKQMTLDNFNVNYPLQLFSDFKGKTDGDFFKYAAENQAKGIATAEEMHNLKKEIYFSLFKDVRLIKGIDEFIRKARKIFKKTGLASSATIRDFSLAAEKYGIDKWFDVIVTGADTIKHKPDPEPYLKALERLGLTSEEVIVIEDSPNGIISAKSAGCFTAAITTSFEAEDLINAGADILANSFEELAEALGMNSDLITK
jgi:beta-phosphoglucomutase